MPQSLTSFSWPLTLALRLQAQRPSLPPNAYPVSWRLSGVRWPHLESLVPFPTSVHLKPSMTSFKAQPASQNQIPPPRGHGTSSWSVHLSTASW